MAVAGAVVAVKRPGTSFLEECLKKSCGSNHRLTALEPWVEKFKEPAVFSSKSEICVDLEKTGRS